MRNILNKISADLPLWTIFIPGLAAFLSWATRYGWVSLQTNVIILVLALTWSLIDGLFVKQEEIPNGIHRIGTRLIMVIYPGFFLWWVDAILGVPQQPHALLLFILCTFLNDSVAWFFGKLLGRHRNITAISPNKSLEGYIAGILTSTAILLTASRIFPDMLNFATWKILLFGIAIGIATALGDLTESAIKRAAKVKDSGTFMLGRGGMLDSIDSLLFTAPLVYLIFKLGA